MERERKTLEAMIDLYCQGLHNSGDGLCPECHALRDYARQRLQKCPYQEGKTTCAKCPTHCYKPAMREQIRAVMRYAGPRMPVRHPLMTLQHMVDGRRQEPLGARKRATGIK
jgi:predicted amidophosphoribosyltransferase